MRSPSAVDSDQLTVGHWPPNEEESCFRVENEFDKLQSAGNWMDGRQSGCHLFGHEMK